MIPPPLIIGLLVGFSLAFLPAQGLDNGLGARPPMGFSTWYDAGCALSEQYILKVADKLVNSGLAKLGYEYLNLDDCWQATRDQRSNVLQADPALFPRGMKTLGAEIHKRGLKFGLYTDRGSRTCQKRPGSQGYEQLDAQTFAEWGVDYLKEDSCYASRFHKVAFREYGLMRDALNRTGRRIFFSLCGWSPWYAPKGRELGNAWRIAPDNLNWNSVYVAAREMERLHHYAGPGGWNDPDFVLGSDPSSKVHLTQRQSRAQFSLWCVMAAPLMLSGPEALQPGTFDFETFSNARAISVNQDVLGIPGKVVKSSCPRLTLPAWTAPFDAPPKKCTQVWAKPRIVSKENFAAALVFVNWDPDESLLVSCDVACMLFAGIPPSATLVSITDVWAKDETTPTSLVHVANLGGPGRIETTLDPSGGSAFLIVEWSMPDSGGDGDLDSLTVQTF